MSTPANITLLHGTSQAKLPGICARGFSKGSYFTDEPALARYYAEEYPDPVVLTVVVPTAILRADTNAYREPISIVMRAFARTEDDWHDMLARDEIPYPSGERDWKTSLAVVHSVKTSASVGAENVLSCR